MYTYLHIYAYMYLRMLSYYKYEQVNKFMIYIYIYIHINLYMYIDMYIHVEIMRNLAAGFGSHWACALPSEQVRFGLLTEPPSQRVLLGAFKCLIPRVQF